MQIKKHEEIKKKDTSFFLKGTQADARRMLEWRFIFSFFLNYQSD